MLYLNMVSLKLPVELKVMSILVIVRQEKYRRITGIAYLITFIVECPILNLNFDL